MDTYVIWAGLLGALSAVSLLIGSIIGVSAQSLSLYVFKAARPADRQPPH